MPATTISDNIADRITRKKSEIIDRLSNNIPELENMDEEFIMKDGELHIFSGEWKIVIDDSVEDMIIDDASEVIFLPENSIVIDHRQNFEIYYDIDVEDFDMVEDFDSLEEAVRFGKKVKTKGGGTKFVLSKNKNKSTVRLSNGKDVSRSSQRERLRKLSKSLKRRFRQNKSKLLKQIKKGKARNKSFKSNKRVA